MSPENRRDNARVEMQEAESRFQAAIERLYYTAFRLVRALLFTMNLEPKSHQAVIRLVHQNLVQTGKLEHRLARVLDRLKSDRENADYTVGWTYEKSDWDEVRPKAAELLDRLRALLEEAGV